jgi:hypothetical protein
MAYNLNKKAPGDAKNTGSPGPSPAPTKETAFGRENYGANAYGGPSSIEPGSKSSSPMADALKAGQDDGQSVLDHVIANGAKISSSQTRPVSNEQKVPTTFGHRSRNGE